MELEFEDDNRTPEDLQREVDQVRIEIGIGKCEMLNKLKKEIPEFIVAHDLHQFDRLKRPKLQKISATEIKVYAVLKGISIRKATEIIRKYNLYIETIRVHQEPADTIKLLIASLNLN